MNIKTIRIVKASSSDREGLLPSRIKMLESCGFKILYEDLEPDPRWPYCAASLESRLAALTKGLIEEESDAVMWARGGYGTSELLEKLPWSTIKQAKPKPILGFSDVCAAQSALYAMTGRLSIHAPMPASSLWGQNGEDDITSYLRLLKGESSTGFLSGMQLIGKRPDTEIKGKIFGGCLSVLTSLIGTPYLPKSLREHILLFEDIGENPGRVMRMLNQWRQSGMLAGVAAIVFGVFKDLGVSVSDSPSFMFEEISRRFDLAIFTTTSFGHVSPNNPFVIGSIGKISGSRLEWRIPEQLNLSQA